MTALNGYKTYVGLVVYALGCVAAAAGWLAADVAEGIQQAGLVLAGLGAAHKASKILAKQ